MVAVGGKAESARTATAGARVLCKAKTLKLIQQGGHKKGDVLATARIAGIQGAKRCADLIPLCHPIRLTSVHIAFELDRKGSWIDIRCTAKALDRTGVEMEALTGASIAALTIYDMCKAVDREMVISEICLLEKKGGKTGTWTRK